MKDRLVLIATFFLMSFAATSQNLRADKLKLFIDCVQTNCDFNYIRQEIPVTDFVRDREVSDIHILITTQSSANGGQKYNVLFIGQKAWVNNKDSFYFFSVPNSSQDDIRKQLVKVIQAGIAPYLAKTGQIDKVNFLYQEDTITEKTATKDEWNNWVFSLGGRARFSGDKNYKEKNISANTSATRVTEKSKLSFFVFNSTQKNSYVIEDNGTEMLLKTINNYFEFEQELVTSISPKWSWAFETAIRKSSYDNLKSAVMGSVGIEYNIFPYKISNSKFFALRYSMEVLKRNYLEETVYEKFKETLYSANFGAYIYVAQPWGNISSSVTWYNYLHDFSKNNFSFDANLEIKLFKGFSIYFNGNASLINDQLSLAKQGATPQEVLLKLKALQTSFTYNTSIGINYRFGSKFNNFVNPRFTSGRD